MSEANFRAGLRSAIRALWSSTFSLSQFEDAISSVIRRNLTVAWSEGARECGILEDELSEEELKARDAFIENQLEFVGAFGEAIREGDKISGEKLTPLYVRAELWVNRYGEARNQAKVMACGDQKLVWRINSHCKEHCRSCVSLNGKVKRASYWARTIQPRSIDLDCGGWRCCCELFPTNEPISRGTLPGFRTKELNVRLA